MTRPWPLITPDHDAVLVHHVSDTHFGYRPWSYDEGDHMLRDLAEGLIPHADLFLHTGDITDNGADPEDAYALGWLGYAGLRADSSLWVMGNHDIRARTVHTRATWEAVYGRSANTFVDVKGIRFITFAVDDFTGNSTVWEPPAQTWGWVAETAEAAPGPVVLATHYPAYELGVAAYNSLQPSAALHQLFGDLPQLTGMMTGHMHRDLSDPTAATFLELGGRMVPHLTDISSMLSLEGEAGRDQSGKVQSTSAYVEILPDVWRVRYRRHGSHHWGGPEDQRVTTMNLSTATTTRTM